MHFLKRFGGELARLVAFAVIFGAVTSSATLYKWSQTASSNSTADGTINWAEGMAPSAVNDSARAMMAAVAKFRDDINGSLTTAGTSTAYTLTTNQSFASLSVMNGQTIRVKMSATNGASPTLNVDSLGAKNIVSVSGTAIATGVLIANGVYDFTYNNSAGEWTVIDGTAFTQIPTGSKVPFWQSACPTGWTVDSTAALNDAALRLTTGTGGGTGGSTAFTSVFTGRTIGQNNLPAVNFLNSGISVTINNPNVTIPIFQSGFGGTAGSSGVQGLNTNNASIAANSGVISAIVGSQGSAASGGGNVAMDFATKYADFIVCTKN